MEEKIDKEDAKNSMSSRQYIAPTHPPKFVRKVKNQNTDINIEEMANFCKRKGFVYANSEIYGGFAGFFDFGHLGTELKNNILSMRRTPISKKYIEVENIISNSADMLYFSEKRPISTEDWKHVPQVVSGVSLLLNSLNDAEVLIDNGEHNNAFKEIVMASVSAEIIKVHANLISDKEVRKYAIEIQQNTKSLMNTIQTNEAIYFEKEAILKQSENLIESEKAYRNAATLFHLLGNTEKELRYKNKANEIDKNVKFLSNSFSAVRKAFPLIIFLF